MNARHDAVPDATADATADVAADAAVPKSVQFVQCFVSVITRLRCEHACTRQASGMLLLVTREM